MGLHVLGDWDSPVLPIMVYHIGLLATLSRRLYDRHIAMVVVGFPATPLLLCRCRICISASHSREDLDYALDAIRDLVLAAGLDYASGSASASGGGGGARGAWRRWAKGGFRLPLAPRGLFSVGAGGGAKGGAAAKGGHALAPPAGGAAPGGERRSSDGASSAGDSSSCSSSSAETSRASSMAGGWAGADERPAACGKCGAGCACGGAAQAAA